MKKYLLTLLVISGFIFYSQKSLAAYPCQCSSCSETGSQAGCTSSNDTKILTEQCKKGDYYDSSECASMPAYLNAMEADCEECASEVKAYNSNIVCSDIPKNGVYGRNAAGFASFIEEKGLDCAYEEDTEDASDASAKTSSSVVSKPLVPCGRTGQPMCTLCDFIVGIKGLIDYGFIIMVVVALAMLIIAGVIYVISAGNEGMMTMAKDRLKNVLVGFAIMLGAWLIINTVMWAIGTKADLGISVTSWNEFKCNGK